MIKSWVLIEIFLSIKAYVLDVLGHNFCSTFIMDYKIIKLLLVYDYEINEIISNIVLVDNTASYLIFGKASYGMK